MIAIKDFLWSIFLNEILHYKKYVGKAVTSGFNERYEKWNGGVGKGEG